MRDIANSFSVGCGVRTDTSAITCWGDGSNIVASTTKPSGTFTQLSVANSHACARRTDGTVVCWGDTSLGRLGAPTGTFAEVVTTTLGGCVRTSAGAASCWGFGSTLPASSYTLLRSGDDGDVCGLTTAGEIRCARRVPPAGSFVDLAVGNGFVCGLTAGGDVQCAGQLETLDAL
ncbi:MAG TPA: RCC1 domain-containing protein [Myxococcota bacterium]